MTFSSTSVSYVRITAQLTTYFYWILQTPLLCGGVFGPAFKARTRINFFTFKVRTFWQSEVKISVLALWLCALSSLCHNMGVGGYGRNPLFVRARHVQRCVKKCPHFECVIHRFVLALNAGTNTLYTRVYIVSSLWMPGQVRGGYRCVRCSVTACYSQPYMQTSSYSGCVGKIAHPSRYLCSQLQNWDKETHFSHICKYS